MTHFCTKLDSDKFECVCCNDDFTSHYNSMVIHSNNAVCTELDNDKFKCEYCGTRITFEPFSFMYRSLYELLTTNYLLLED